MIVKFHRDFDKSFKKLPVDVKKKFIQRKEIFVKDPLHRLLNNHTLAGEWQGYRSINVTGDYRAVYSQMDKDTVLFVEIGTHPQLYR